MSEIGFLPLFMSSVDSLLVALPLVPNMVYIGGVRNGVCGQHQRSYSNVGMRGKSCPEAWTFGSTERVCSKVLPLPDKVLSTGEVDWQH